LTFVTLSVLGALACVMFAQTARALASSDGTSFGVDLPTGLYSTSAVSSFQSTAGVPVGIVQSFVSWKYTDSSTDNAFPTSQVENIVAAGHTPEITWEPTISGDSSHDQPTMSLAAIADGDYDSYITQFAKAAAAVKAPIMLRFASEMNGSWMSYSEANSGNQPGDFVRAWQHVWDLFHADGVTNVAWIWSPNIVNAGDNSLAELYPGNAYVNWVGMDGYSYPLEGCETAQQEFTPALDEIEKITDKPVMIAETAVAASCSSKPALITDLFSWLKTQPEIRSITWWEQVDSSSPGDYNYLVESSAASTAAFQTAIKGWEKWLSVTPSAATSPTPTTTTAGTAGTVAHAGPTSWGLIGDETTTAAQEKAAGITSKIIRISWADFETSPGVFSASYEASKQAEIASLESAGMKVILDLGLQGTPSWIHQYPDSYLQNQYGEPWTSSTVPGQTVDDSTANLVFNSQLRTLAAAYIDQVAQDFGGTAQAIRIGGGVDGELDYPPASTPGHTNDYWAFDASAQAQSPVPGWKPGDGSPNGQAQTFLNWYLNSLTTFEDWQISTLRSAYPGPIIVLFPGWGIRPGQTAAAVADNLDGQSGAESTGEIPRADDFVDQVAAINQANVWAETTWLDAPEYGSDSSTDPDEWTPVHYLSSLVTANPFHPELWGENTGEGSTSAMTYAIRQACTYDVQGVVWYDENQLLSGTYATLPNYKTAITTGCK
jgi:hypothetical protein